MVTDIMVTGKITTGTPVSIKVGNHEISQQTKKYVQCGSIADVSTGNTEPSMHCIVPIDMKAGIILIRTMKKTLVYILSTSDTKAIGLVLLAI